MNGFDRVVSFVCDAKWDRFPAEVREKAKVCLLDGLCAVIAGKSVPVVKIARDYSRTLWPTGDNATILMDDSRSSVVGAAFVNACAGNALDIDDGCRHVKGHPGAQLIPVALAMSEQQRCSGQETLTALVIGYEVAMRIGHVWHKTRDVYQACGSWGSVANAAVTARLMGLDRDGTKNALGLAEYHAPNLPIMTDVDHPTMAKHGIGWGAVTGVMAAGLAAHGYTGVPSILADPAHLEWVGSIGSEYPFVAGVTFKHFASCLWGHPALMACADLMRGSNISVEDIANIKIRGFHEMVRLGIRRPRTEEEAQFSVGWPLAAYLLEGELGPGQMLAHRFDDKAILELLNKIEMVEDPKVEAVKEIGRWPCIIEITAKDNRQFISDLIVMESGRIGEDLGPFAYLWRHADIQAKFARFTSGILTPEQIDGVIDAVDHLDTAPDVTELIRLCIGDW